MVLNFRYHVFTITAIFAALGIGILIGTSFIGDDGLIKEQRKIIDNIGHDINRLKAEKNNLIKANNILREEIKYRLEIEKKILPLTLKNRLDGRKYYLFYINGIEKSRINDFKYLLKKAGAEINFNTMESLITANVEQINPTNDQINRIILWNTDKTERDFFKSYDKDMVISYHNEDVPGLLLALLEVELNEAGN